MPEDASQPIAVGAVVVNFNGGERILACLRVLGRQSVRLAAITVVDNGSTDGSPERIAAEFPQADLVRLGENRGLPAARNAGLRRLDTDLVLIVDHDVYPADDCLELLLRSYRANRPAVLCPRLVLLPEGNVVQCDGAAAHFVGTMALRHGYQPLGAVPAETASVGACLGACLLVERKTLLDAGGFDEAFFFYLEDLEISLRLRALGHRLVCEAAAIAHHDRGRGTPGLSYRGEGPYPTRRAYLTMRHRLLIILVHYRVRTLVVLLPALALYEGAALLVALSRGWGLEWARAWCWQFANLAAIRQRRRLVQGARLRDDRELLEGGIVPFAPGFARSAGARIGVGALSAVLGAYWALTRRWIG